VIDAHQAPRGRKSRIQEQCHRAAHSVQSIRTLSRISILCLWFVSIGFALPAATAQEMRPGSGSQRNPWRIEVFGSLSYDSNILRLSDADVQEFVDGVGWDRYHISTYDDLMVTLGMRCRYQARLMGTRMTRAGVRYRQHHYSNNPIIDRENLLVWGEQEVLRGHRLRLGYYYVPHYYIRHLPDVDISSSSDVSRYRAFDFSSDYYYGEWRMDRRWKIAAKAALGWRSEDYNADFGEYDTDVLLWDIDASLAAARWFTVEGGYRFENADAQGYDNEGETRSTSDDVDASFERDSYWGGLRIDLDDLVQIPLAMSCLLEYRKKTFTSDKGVDEDPFHFERVDRDRQLDLELVWGVNRSFELSGRYGFAAREVDSPMRDLIVEEKDYTKGVFELGFAYVLVP